MYNLLMENIILDTSHLKDLKGSFYDLAKTMPLKEPKIVSINEKFCYYLGFTNKQLNSKEFIEFLNGSYILDGSITHSNAYSGHQFSYFVPNLGDGRAIGLGKLTNNHLQLKGSGITKYSRDGDGRAVLRSSIREYLASIYMDALDIPTTQVVGIISSNTNIYRSYTPEKASIVLRASSSWIRFGSFEFAYMGKNKKENLKNLADFVIDESYPHLKELDNKYDELFFEIVDKTIDMIALWQSVGFMHGVMNTDNMSIEGLTIDYGPYAFMEQFDKEFICNLSDKEGRYSFENQPYIAQWNLSVLAKVLSPIANEELMNSYNDMFIGKFKKKYFSIMAKKLGLDNYSFNKDGNLIAKLFKATQEDKVDYTSFFHCLSADTLDLEGENINEWLKLYNTRLEDETVSKEDRLSSMRKINPKYILRNYMLQDAIDNAEQGDFTLVNDFLEIAQNPYGDFPKYEHYTKPKPNWEPLKCSCSS
ncbi:MAG: YdiU family protein [Campylobacterota bacterium]|nr:YdiU family protein [Campylobacterota bacterium]